MDAAARYAEIVDDLVARNDNVQATKMMGMPSVKRAGKLVAGFVPDEDAMVFKFPHANDRDAALGLKGAHLFAPMQGRQMKEWVVVPKAHEKEWPKLAERAVR
ncbi:MAG TPA: hypothetical protein VGQ84_13215 [Gaiellaceae bacterium]|jgi:hypothetical protein|nr:hypothetical protein [Gaiellaceae bacterium]